MPHDYLIFIDTNIILDFYRIRNSDVNLAYLDSLSQIKDSIIVTSQIEMEYKKNRQAVILETLNQHGKDEEQKNIFPALLGNYQPVKMYAKKKKELKTQSKKIKEKIIKIFENPSSNDKVFLTMKTIFSNESTYNLNIENNLRYKIRHKARKRFFLGYPPRKDKDTSYGDAINWEWIISCAQSCDKDIILVSRDSDYGTTYLGKSYLNDWLRQEFKERVSRKRNIIYTQKLSEALKKLEQTVSREMEEEEDRIISEHSIETLGKSVSKRDPDTSKMTSMEILEYLGLLPKTKE